MPDTDLIEEFKKEFQEWRGNRIRHYTDLPKDLQKWGQQIELEYIQTISDRALAFQATEAEAGRVVSITEAVHHVTARIRRAIESKVEPLDAEDQKYFNRLCGVANNVSDEDEEEDDDEDE